MAKHINPAPRVMFRTPSWGPGKHRAYSAGETVLVSQHSGQYRMKIEHVYANGEVRGTVMIPGTQQILWGEDGVLTRVAPVSAIIEIEGSNA